MTPEGKMMDDFLELSSILTSIPVGDLRQTGLAQSYFDNLLRYVGRDLTIELMAVYKSFRIQCKEAEKLRFSVKQQLRTHPKLGPVARNLLKMWRTAHWHQMPQHWQDQYGQTLAEEINSEEGFAAVG